MQQGFSMILHFYMPAKRSAKLAEFAVNLPAKRHQRPQLPLATNPSLLFCEASIIPECQNARCDTVSRNAQAENKEFCDEVANVA
jgi:hypothetical protein